MLDKIIRGGQVVDGTGAPARVADVGIKDGRIVAVGEIDEPATETIDASGLLVTQEGHHRPARGRERG